jgi:molybdopterin converting factor small subunit
MGGGSFVKRTIGLILTSLLLLVTLVACGSRSIDAQSLASIELTGADGFASIAVKTDEQAILTLIEEAMSELKDNDEKGLERLFKREAALNSIIFTAEKMADLKNGDEINIRASYDEQLAKDAGIKFRNTQFKYLVEGLTDALAIDVKNNVKLLFEGYDGLGTATLELDGEVEAFSYAFNFIFQGDKTNLTNGDRVALKVVPNNTVLTSHGKIARETSLSFEVQGLAPMASVDLFSDLVLIFDGISDQGSVSFDTTRLPSDWVEAGSMDRAPLQFFAFPENGLANGDKLTVQAQIDEQWFSTRGLKPVTLEKEYEATGLKEYPRNLDDIDLVPLFEKIETWIGQDIHLRLVSNYWNRDYRAGEPVSRWDYRDRFGVKRIYYGYDQTDRADNFIAIIYEVSVEGTCVEATPYQSSYEEGETLSSTLYLVYVIDRIMYDRADITDYYDINLKLHSDVELDVISTLKHQYGSGSNLIVEAAVPPNVAYQE